MTSQILACSVTGHGDGNATAVNFNFNVLCFLMYDIFFMEETISPEIDIKFFY